MRVGRARAPERRHHERIRPVRRRQVHCLVLPRTDLRALARGWRQRPRWRPKPARDVYGGLSATVGLMGQARLTAASGIVRTGKSLLIGQGVNNSCSEAGPRVKGARGRGMWLGHWGCWAGASGSPRNGPSAERRGEATCVRRISAADRACTPRESSSSTHGGDALRVPTHAEPHRYRGERSGGVAAPM